MNLIPFHPSFSEQIHNWNLDPAYRRFFCGITKFLTLDECAHLPQVFQREILMISTGVSEKFVGMVSISDDPNGIAEFGLLVDKKAWGEGIGKEALQEIENYCFNVKGTRMLRCQVSTTDVACNHELVKNNFTLVGSIKDFSFINGKYEDNNLYYKIRGN